MARKPKVLFPLIGAIALLIIASSAVPGYGSKTGQAPPEAALVGNAACRDCHEEVSDAFAGTIHGLTADASGRSAGCESCHGPGSAHIEAADPALIHNPGKGGQFEQSVCLGCHNTEAFDSWSVAHHNRGDVGCADCHKVHAEHQAWTPEYVQKTCYNCHGNVQAASFMPSHHPIREGKVTCLDCHNPHGGPVRFVQEETGRELCLSCHPEKEGPFVFEHAPVNEDCLVCHAPHGSVANNLLVANEPTLCLNCHAMHFHATVEGVDGAFSVPQAPDRAGVSTVDGWKKGMLTKCTQCHTQIHGSDLPSQAGSTAGNTLTR